jgi:hypothetical protein
MPVAVPNSFHSGYYQDNSSKSNRYDINYSSSKDNNLMDENQNQSYYLYMNRLEEKIRRLENINDIFLNIIREKTTVNKENLYKNYSYSDLSTGPYPYLSFDKNKNKTLLYLNRDSINNNKIENGNNNANNPNFTNFMQDLDISFVDQNQNGIEQNDVFNTNYIKMKTNYNEDIIEYLNKIRNEPIDIINDIDDLLNQSKKILDEKIQIESEETHENLILDDGGEALSKTKDYLNKVVPIKIKFNLNEDLFIDICESDKNMDLSLDKKISKILTDKRKNIVNKYPDSQFFISFIKDKKMSLLFLLSQNENISNFRNIIFDDKYTQFNITWMKEKKKIYIAFLCFA